jgi:Abnormal spindle-like microcephaly-assoc'd, ASPM-SPD-2-Hydin
MLTDLDSNRHAARELLRMGTNGDDVAPPANGAPASSSPPPPPQETRVWKDYSTVTRLSPATLLAVDVAWYLLLIAALLGREFRFLWVDRLPAVIDGVLPIIVPWAGILGGVTISVVGIVAHWREWGPRARKDSTVVEGPLRQRLDHNAWHLTRPLVGMAFGTSAALIVVLITGAVERDTNNAIDVSPKGAATLMIISFVVAYRESTFRDLVERVVDTVIGPGGDAATGVTFELTPDALDFGDVIVDTTSAPQVVTLANPGTKSIQNATLVVEGGGPFTLSASRLSRIAPGRSDTVAVRCSPTEGGAMTGTLSVTVGGTLKHVQLKAVAKA